VLSLGRSGVMVFVIESLAGPHIPAVVHRRTSSLAALMALHHQFAIIELAVLVSLATEFAFHRCCPSSATCNSCTSWRSAATLIPASKATIASAAAGP
jgi:hypothetical protein